MTTTDVQFSDIKDKLKEIIKDKLKTGFPKDPEGFTLLPGFFAQPIQKELNGKIIMKGPIDSLPMVGIIGNSTGLVYFYALNALLNQEKNNHDRNN